MFGAMTVTRFLREYWQKKPLLVRAAIPDFREPFSPDELAGLACEDGVESRIVREKGGRRPWEVTWGPQSEESFAALPERGWTLLVQELNRHVPEAALLLERFTFVPNVRVDDVMVSFAAPGGSVGPHVDSYDVFLVQGHGKRRWQYGTKRVKDARFRQGLELRILERFEFDRDDVLEAGDMLYLPPGFAHHGVALTPCTTYSVGFRSPGFGEMWRSFAETRGRGDDGARLLEDPKLSPATDPGAIPEAMLARVRAAVRASRATDDAIDRWFASFATRLKPGHVIEPPSRRTPLATILERLARGAVVVRTEEGRWAHLPRPGGAVYLYVGGEELAVPRGAAALARHLASQRRFDGADLLARAKGTKGAKGKDGPALLVRLFDSGALAFAARRRAW